MSQQPQQPQTPRGLSLRPLEPADLEVIFYRGNRSFGREWLERQARGEVYVAVACLDGLPVGRSGLDFVRVRHPNTAYLWAAHVEPHWQSRGIGAALFAHLDEAARARNLEQIYLAVAKDNPRAQALYERLGYRVYDQQVLSWSYFDDYGRQVTTEEDSWLLIKPLEPITALPNEALARSYSDGHRQG